MERLISLMPPDSKYFIFPDLFIAALGDTAQKEAFTLCNRLRVKGIKTEMDYSGKSLKSQMKRADKLKSRYTLILGDKEIAEKRAELRNMLNGTQLSLDLSAMEDNIINAIKER
jgi:histidyl-tRNA synthetase